MATKPKTVNAVEGVLAALPKEALVLLSEGSPKTKALGAGFGAAVKVLEDSLNNKPGVTLAQAKAAKRAINALLKSSEEDHKEAKRILSGRTR